MKICICIPARYNSSRLEYKLLKKLNKITVIERTIIETLKNTYTNDIYILKNNQKIFDLLKNKNYNIKTIITNKNCKNGTERISRNLNKFNLNYDIIVNIQADEPFIDYRNIDFAITKYLECKDNNIYYTTLHQKIDNLKYLNSSSCITVQFDNNNNVLTYSRSILPGNKNNKPDLEKINYYGFTGIYVFNTNLLKNYHDLPNSKYQTIEEIEQMIILENGYKIKTYECPYFNEISLNDINDYNYLLEKYYNIKNKNKKIKLAIFDFDGVFTDGKIYVDENGIKTKCYNGKDSFGLKIIKDYNITTALITADNSECVKKATHIFSRMDKISIGNYNKIEVLNKWLQEFNISYEEVSYIGDDLFDIPILEKVGLSGCPSDAIDEVKKVCNIICKKSAGNGCVREFINKIINYNNN